MRLIDADGLKYAQRYARADPDSDRLVPVYAADRKQIDEAPTVDAVPVVRCRECKWWVDRYCEHPYGLRNPGPSSFCDCGCRREQSTDSGKIRDGGSFDDATQKM